MPRTIRIAAFQLRAHDRADFASLWTSLLERIASATRDCDLLLLPEGTIPAYVLGDAPLDDVAIADAVTSLRALAAQTRTVIVVGVAARGPHGKLYNRALAIERDGTIAGYADKIFLWDFDRRWFCAGQRIAPVSTSLGRLGLLVCADGRMPEIARELVERGAEMLVMPTAWVTSGREPATLENAQADSLARVRAYENGVPFVAANKCGTECGIVAYCGKSQIIDAHGEMLALASQDSEQVIRASIRLEHAAPYRCTHRAEMTTTIPDSADCTASVRVAMTLDMPAAYTATQLTLLDAVALDEIDDAVRLDDDALLDPSVLVKARLDGCRLVIWRVRKASPWTQRVACARALELRIYVVVLDRGSDRAYAVDPDGRVIAGTFAGYRTTCFWLDAAQTRQTLIAPGTDVLEGLVQVRALIEGEEA